MSIPTKGVVLRSGESDHCPFIKQFWFPDEGSFIVADWNAHHDSSYAEVERILGRLVAEASVLILQEINKSADRIPQNLAKKYGWRYRSAAEFAIVWDPEVWEFVRSDLRVMSTKPYWASPNRALIVVLRHKRTGREVRFMSYHPPAHVQAPGHVTHDNVMAVYRDFCNERQRIARNSNIPCCFAGDGNVDPKKGWAPPNGWGFAFNQPPLDYVRAPEPTHGNRHIDEFMIDGVRAAPK